jgi:copper chaperone CopZ
MKWKIFNVAMLLAVCVLAVNGFSIQKTIIKVSGKCGMCETRIETAALSVKGVESAEWDKESGKLEVVYNADKANSEKIQKAIAKAGHDTELYTANDKVYEKLPECCKYERADAKASGCCSGTAAKASCGSASASCGSAKTAPCSGN